MARKRTFRIYLFKKIAHFKNQGANIEVRNILDIAEDELGASSAETLEELMDFENEQLISIVNPSSDMTISPYSTIVVNNKFYANL